MGSPQTQTSRQRWASEPIAARPDIGPRDLPGLEGRAGEGGGGPPGEQPPSGSCVSPPTPSLLQRVDCSPRRSSWEDPGGSLLGDHDLAPDS